MSKKETFQSNLAEIDEIIIKCEKNGNKEFADKIKEKLNNIFRSYASEVYFDDGLDTFIPAMMSAKSLISPKHYLQEMRFNKSIAMLYLERLQNFITRYRYKFT